MCVMINIADVWQHLTSADTSSSLIVLLTTLTRNNSMTRVINVLDDIRCLGDDGGEGDTGELGDDTGDHYKRTY